MDPIEIELRLALDKFKGDAEKAQAYVAQKFNSSESKSVSSQVSSAMSNAVKEAARNVDDIGRKLSRSMGGGNVFGAGGSSGFWAKNPHLAALLGNGSSSPPIKPPGVARAGFDPLGMGDTSTGALLARQRMDDQNASAEEKKRMRAQRALDNFIKQNQKHAVREYEEGVRKKELAEKALSNFLKRNQQHAVKEFEKMESDRERAAKAAERAKVKAHNDRVNFMRDMSFLMMPVFNPGSMWATMFSTRQTFSALSKTSIGQSLTGGSIAGAAAGTGLLVGATTALGLAFAALKKSAEEISKAFSEGANLYSRVLRSGSMAAGFVTQRSNLARILGVSENEVYRLTGAVADLAKQSAMASDSMRRNMRTLTGVEQTKRMVELNNEAARHEKGRFWSGVFGYNSKSDLAFSKFNLWSNRAMNNFMSKLGFEGFTPAAPTNIASANRYQTSAFERQGLVVGADNGMNPISETAKNTSRANTLLERIANAIDRDRQRWVDATGQGSKANPVLPYAWNLP